MAENKPKRSCLPGVLMVSGFLLFCLTAMAIPSMSQDYLYIGIIFTIISLGFFLAGVIMAFIFPHLRKSESPKNPN